MPSWGQTLVFEAHLRSVCRSLMRFRKWGKTLWESKTMKPLQRDLWVTPHQPGSGCGFHISDDSLMVTLMMWWLPGVSAQEHVSSLHSEVTGSDVFGLSVLPHVPSHVFKINHLCIRRGFLFSVEMNLFQVRIKKSIKNDTKTQSFWSVFCNLRRNIVRHVFSHQSFHT